MKHNHLPGDDKSQSFRRMIHRFPGKKKCIEICVSFNTSNIKGMLHWTATDNAVHTASVGAVVGTRLGTALYPAGTL